MSETPIDDVKIFNIDPTIVKIVDKDTKESLSFEITEFTFESRTKFIKLMMNIFKEVANFKDDVVKKNDMEMIFWIIDIAGDKLLEVYSLILGRDVEWVKKNLTLKTEVSILTAVIEVNEIPFLMRQIQASIKRMMA